MIWKSRCTTTTGASFGWSCAKGPPAAGVDQTRLQPSLHTLRSAVLAAVNLKPVWGVLGAGAKIASGASTAALVLGALYLADCRISARGMDQVDRCYFTAMPLMGIGVAGRGGFSLGYNTYNPALRKEDHEEGRGRDEHGRFVRRERG